MTRFIGEPSGLRHLAGERARVESLARRPAPVALSGAFDGLRLRRTAGSTLTVADVSTPRVPWNSYTAENAAFLRRNAGTPSDPNPATVDNIQLMLKGLYSMTAVLRWVGLWTGERGIFWEATSGDLSDLITEDPFQLAPINSAHGSTEDAVTIVFHNNQVGKIIELHATQRSGASREVSAAGSWWESFYLGTTSLDT